MKNIDKYKTYEYSTGNPMTSEWCQVYELDKALEAIKVRNMNDQDRIRYLKEENKKLKDNLYKDEQLSLMENELNKMKDDYYRGFPISEEEDKNIKEWIDNHERDVHGCYTLEDKINRGGCCGGTYIYEFVPTSIGKIGTVRCKCGAKYTFQDMV